VLVDAAAQVHGMLLHQVASPHLLLLVIPQLNAPPPPAPQYQLQIPQVLLHFQPVCEGFHWDLKGQEEQLNQGAVQQFVIQDEVS
jgi:hypothetical protein